jgi:DNA end-binding protein Ku
MRYAPSMAPRAHWKGYLRLSLVQSPVALYPATTESERIGLHQIDRNSGHRIRYLKVDAQTGRPVDADDIIWGYQIAKGRYVPITPRELDQIAPESRHIIDIDQFVPGHEIDALYHLRPYWVAPDGEVGADAFAVIRDTMERMGRVAIGRVVLTNREHIIALEPRHRGMLGMLLRYPQEIRKADAYFDDIPDVRLPRDMLELAAHIVKAKSGHFRPEIFEDRYQQALRDLVRRKEKGEPIASRAPAAPTNVVNLMDALRQSVAAQRTAAATAAAPARTGPRGSRKRRTGRTPRRGRAA